MFIRGCSKGLNAQSSFKYILTFSLSISLSVSHQARHLRLTGPILCCLRTFLEYNHRRQRCFRIGAFHIAGEHSSDVLRSQLTLIGARLLSKFSGYSERSRGSARHRRNIQYV